MKETTFNEKILKIESAEKFFYGEVSADSLKELNIELYNKVSEYVKYFIENEEKIKAEEVEKAKAAQLVEKQKDQEAFLALINPYFAGIEYILKPASIGSYNVKSVYVSLGNNISVCLYYDGTIVDRSSSWGRAMKTDRCWVMEDDSHKKTRYTSIEKACEKAKEKLQEIKAAKLRELSANLKEENDEATMKAYAESKGFTFEKSWHSNPTWNRKMSMGYYRYFMKNDIVSCRMNLNDEGNIVLSSITIIPSISIEKVLEISNLIK